MRSCYFLAFLVASICCVSVPLAAETSCLEVAQQAAFRAHKKKYSKRNSYGFYGRYDLGIADPTLSAFPRRVYSIEICDEANGAVWLVATNAEMGCRVEALVSLEAN